MSRSERRAAARRAKKASTERSLSGWRYAVMVVVTFAMVFSSLGYIASYGGALAAAACVGICCAVALLLWLIMRKRAKDVSTS